MIACSSVAFGQSNQKGVFRTDTSKSEHIVDIEIGYVDNLGYNYLFNFNNFFSLGTRIGFHFYNNKKGGILPEESKYGLVLSYGVIANLHIWQSVFFEFRANHVPSIQWPTQENTNDSGISISESVFFRIHFTGILYFSEKSVRVVRKLTRYFFVITLKSNLALYRL